MCMEGNLVSKLPALIGFNRNSKPVSYFTFYLYKILLMTSNPGSFMQNRQKMRRMPLNIYLS